jgi:hypothetical protein
VVAAVEEAHALIREARAEADLVLVLGGDDTVELATVAAHVDAPGARLGLIHFDARPDLNTPQDVSFGALHAMVNAHLIAEAGALDDLTRVGPRVPLLEETDLLLFAYSPAQATAGENDLLERWAIPRARPVPRSTASPGTSTASWSTSTSTSWTSPTCRSRRTRATATWASPSTPPCAPSAFSSPTRGSSP